MVEGVGDKEFLNKLLNLDILRLKYKVELVNAKGKNNILEKFKITKQTHSNSNVYIFIDLDGKGNKRIQEFQTQLKQKGLKEFLGSQNIFFVNPIIEYFFLLSKKFSNPKIVSKDEYKPFIKECYGIDEYCCSLDQVQEIIKKISSDNFLTFLDNIKLINIEPNDLPSSNIRLLIDILQR